MYPWDSSRKRGIEKLWKHHLLRISVHLNYGHFKPFSSSIMCFLSCLILSSVVVVSEGVFAHERLFPFESPATASPGGPRLGGFSAVQVPASISCVLRNFIWIPDNFFSVNSALSLLSRAAMEDTLDKVDLCSNKSVSFTIRSVVSWTLLLVARV